MFACVTIVLRLVGLIWFFNFKKWIASVLYITSTAKLCVGLIQSWILVEISCRIRKTHQQTDCKLGQVIVLSIASLGFLFMTIFVITSAKEEEN